LTPQDPNRSIAYDADQRPDPTPIHSKDSEIASLIAYLASAEASFVTGAAFTIDGGYPS
jgi:NAD(P)-dependent dehydrogenase (short-subunit alcohol dehydrogenase family)